jgi:hypothetical protein
MNYMSVEPEPKDAAGPAETPRNLDLTGLPAPVADELRKLVETLRGSLVHAPSPPGTFAGEPPEEWTRRLQAWVDTHPGRPVAIDDSRESLYTGRGE